jgi:hypothetical protein
MGDDRFFAGQFQAQAGRKRPRASGGDGDGEEEDGDDVGGGKTKPQPPRRKPPSHFVAVQIESAEVCIIYFFLMWEDVPAFALSHTHMP